MVTTDLVQPGRPRRVRVPVAVRALLIWIALALPSGISVVSASPFAWRAPASCLSADDVRTRIERRLGGSLEDVVHGIEIEIVRERGGFVAHIDARALTVANDIR